MQILSCRFWVVLLFSFIALESHGSLADGPVQTFLGPGGQQYAHEGFSHWESGTREERYHVFEPDLPVATSSRFVVFLHDWMNSSPEYYKGWIRHLTRKGWVVVFPRYQGQSSSEKYWLFNAVRSVKDYQQQAFDRGIPAIDTSSFSIIGHGSGAILAANMAATSDYFGLPNVGVLFVVMPHQRNLKIQNLSGISSETLMAVVTGDQVSEENELVARDIFYAADRVRTSNKIHLTAISDYYGQPPLIADERAPLSPEKPLFERFIIQNRHRFLSTFTNKFSASHLRGMHIDAFDWFVCFRVFDALSDQAYSQNYFDVLTDNPELRFMGYWSDGRRLKELLPTKRP